MKIKNKTKTITLCSLFTALIIIGAFIKIPGPFVPFTLQFLFCSLCAMVLGPRKGTVSVLVYIAIGLLGFPVFTGGGGFSYIFKPTFGYLLGFVLASLIIGFIVERIKNITVFKLFLASIFGLLALYVIALPYYYIIVNYYLATGINIANLLLYCFLIFLPTDLFLCFLSSLLGKRLLAVLKNKN